jgi:hypothetical protein
MAGNRVISHNPESITYIEDLHTKVYNLSIGVKQFKFGT